MARTLIKVAVASLDSLTRRIGETVNNIIDELLNVPRLDDGTNVFTGREYFGLNGSDGYVSAGGSGNANIPGYLEFFTGDGVRRGYVGYYDGSSHLYFDGENGWTFAFADGLLIQGGTAWHSANDGSGSGLDADLLDGGNGGPAGSYSANTYARYHASSGYLFANYFNQDSGNNENPTVSQVIVQNGSDGYNRKASVAHVKRAVVLSCTIQSDPGGTPSGTAGDVFFYY